MKKLLKLLLATSLLSLSLNSTVYIPLPGGGTPGFWSNKNGMEILSRWDFYYLNRLGLVDQSGNPVYFDTAPNNQYNLDYAKDQFRKWIRGGNAKNMQYQLSRQLAAFYLNVIHYKWGRDEYVGNSGFTSAYLIYYSKISLNGPVQDRELQEYFKDILDWANNQAENR